MSRTTKPVRLFVAFLCLMILMALASVAVATSNNSHTVNGNWHGHGVAGFYENQTHAWTDYNNSSQKHASVDVIGGGSSYCSATGADTHVHCTANVLVSNVWSHHWGPNITNHYHG